MYLLGNRDTMMNNTSNLHLLKIYYYGEFLKQSAVPCRNETAGNKTDSKT